MTDELRRGTLVKAVSLIVFSHSVSWNRSKAECLGFNGVVKFSWTSDLRPPEAELLQKANDRGVKGLAKLVGHDKVTSVKKLRRGLVFEASHNFRSV